MIYLAPLIFALADFITGRDYFKKLHLPGRSIWYVAPALMLLLWPFSHALSFLALGWALWRSVLGWSTFGGRVDIKTRGEFDAMLVRNVVSIIPSILISYFLGITSPLTWIIFALFAVFPNSWYGYMTEKNKDVGPWVDIMHGLLYGLFAAILIHG